MFGLRAVVVSVATSREQQRGLVCSRLFLHEKVLLIVLIKHKTDNTARVRVRAEPEP